MDDDVEMYFRTYAEIDGGQGAEGQQSENQGACAQDDEAAQRSERQPDQEESASGWSLNPFRSMMRLVRIFTGPK